MIAALEDLWTQTQPVWPGLSVEHVQRIDSTNSALLARARRGHTDPVLLIADEQTAGRGRSGKAWHSVVGQDICASLGVVMQRADLSGLSLAVGVALAQGLNQLLHPSLDQPTTGNPGPTVLLKWPNDLWVMQDAKPHKLGGILIETLTLSPTDAYPSGGGRYVVIGLGINVAARVVASDSALPSASEVIPAIGWCNLTPPPMPTSTRSDLDRQHIPQPGVSVLQAISQPLLHMVQDFDRLGFAPWLDDYAQLDALLSQGVRTKTPIGIEPSSPVLVGKALGVNAQGALQLQGVDGSVHSIHSGEVSVRFA